MTNWYMTGLAVTAVGRKNYRVENNNMDKNSIDKLHEILKVQEHLKKDRIHDDHFSFKNIFKT